MTAKEYLQQLITSEDEINKKLHRLETLRDVAMNISPKYSGEAVQRTRVKNPLENVMTKIVDLDREIDADIDALIDLKAEVLELLDKLENEKHKRILWQHYAERKSWTQIAGIENLTRRHIIRLYGEGIKNFEKIIKK